MTTEDDVVLFDKDGNITAPSAEALRKASDLVVEAQKLHDVRQQRREAEVLAWLGRLDADAVKDVADGLGPPRPNTLPELARALVAQRVERGRLLKEALSTSNEDGFAEVARALAEPIRDLVYGSRGGK